MPITSSDIKFLTTTSTMATTSLAIPIEQRDPSESAVRGASLTPFIPISEETVFLDADPVTSSGCPIFNFSLPKLLNLSPQLPNSSLLFLLFNLFKLYYYYCSQKMY